MSVSSTVANGTRHSAAARRRRWAWLVGAPIAALLIVAIAVLGHFIDEPMRRRLEATLNERMTGYTVRLPRLDFHPLGFSLTLHGLSVRQNAHPKPPVLEIDTLDAGVHWRALLRLRLVADFELDHPRVHINRPQLIHETEDTVAVEDKGWQEALEAIYPLKINEFRISNGELTYVDDDPKRPLQITQGEFLATNIRNVRAPADAYPSPVHLTAAVFERGRLKVDGDANFLAEPHAGMRADIDLRNVPLERLKPVAIHANVHVTGGVLNVAQGAIEYAPKVQDVHMKEVRIDDVAVDYVHSTQTAVAEARRFEQVKDKAEELANRPTVSATVDLFSIRNGTLGYVDESTTPDYRLFLAAADLDVRDFSNRSEVKPVTITASGLFDGSGKTTLKSTFLPRQKNPEAQMALEIEQARMRAMNDLFRAYGDFDVVDGRFSLYTQLQIKDGHIDGYIKPLFADLDVYDRRQDRDKAVFQQLYEGLVGGVGELLENRRDQVATQATLSGEASQPQLSTLEVVINLIRNAFFKAILPGFEHAVREAGAKPDTPTE